MVFQERTYAVLIVSAGDRMAEALTALLPVTDFYPVKRARSAGEARRSMTEQEYDLIFINAPLPDDSGQRLAEDACQGDAAVLLFVKSEDLDAVAAQVTPFGVVPAPKPTSTAVVVQCIRALCALRERLRRMEVRQQSVEEKIQEIRLVNRAKWALIQRRGMSEEEAHRHIEKRSMDQRLPRATVARQILAACEDLTELK